MLTTTKAFGTGVITCILTQKAYLFGGTNDDIFAEAVMDTAGNIYAAGSSYSPTYSNGEQDVVILAFDYTAEYKWGRYWGGSLSETATSIALDPAETYLYVCGYSNSVGTLSVGGYDMFVLKIVISAGLITWAQRIGSSANE